MNEIRFLRAIDRGDVFLLKQLIGSGHNFNQGVGQRKMPPVIYYAVQKNFTEAVELLINSGIDVNVKYTSELKTPLYLSSQTGSEPITDLLCRSGAKINEVTQRGETPLFAAIEWSSLSKDLNVVKTLLSYGADVNVIACNGTTPLIKAIESDYFPVIVLLIENGATLDLKEYKELKTALKLNNDLIIEYLLKRYYREICDQSVSPSVSPVDLCLHYFNLNAMRLSIEMGFRATDSLFEIKSWLVLLKTILPNSHQNISDAKFCFDYLMTFSHLIDFNETFAFKYELPNNTKIITGNLLTYSLLFNCSYMTKRLIQIGVPIESSIFNYYRFDYNDSEALKMLFLCGLKFPKSFCSKCYPNSNNTDTYYKTLNKYEFKEFCQWIETQSSQPFSLTEIIRIYLRNKFGSNLSKVVTKLEIPNLLVNFVMFDN